MNITINPFQQMYFSDDTQVESAYVALFSDEVLQSAINPVFQGGNVVLSGTQGCGKTMILSLLRPETRLAYHNQGKSFPVNERIRRFISAGVNLTRSKITDVIQVTLGRGEEVDERELPFYFADFFNYWVVDDLLCSIEKVGEHPEVFDEIVRTQNIGAFVECLANQDCWFGALDGIDSLDLLKDRIKKRIGLYRSWVNGNMRGPLPIEMLEQKTNIGEPIARAAECLRRTGVIDDTVPILIRVDQIEEMHKAFSERQKHLLLSFRKMLNRAFASRDARVHYRAGTRPYGWNNPNFLNIWGSEARLEARRDYHPIDMDAELFARHERSNTIFGRFAMDAFRRRVAYYFERKIDDVSAEIAKSVFGKHPIAEERLAQLNLSPTDAQIDRALDLDSTADGGHWSSEWRVYLRGLYRTDHSGMLDASLAAAWGRQTGGARSKKQHRESPPPDNTPWRTRKWWRKERLDQAVLQLTTRCQQRFMWWGYGDVLSLSGGNISVFFHICHRVWDSFLKNESSLPEKKRTDLLNGGTIDRNIQSAAILHASNEWYKKLPEEPGGNSRQNFAERLGIDLNDEMMRDISMSYPGGNGISVSTVELESNDGASIREFLREAVGYAALMEIEHSSRSKASGRRFKYYLNPILCPRYQLPEAHTKEPRYRRLEDLYDLAKRAKVTLVGIHKVREQHQGGATLFDNLAKEAE